MEAKERIILHAEETFARRVALGAIVRRPVKPLLQLIPGMFIIDFLKRTQEIRRYTRYYLFPRKTALENAFRNIRSESRKDASDGERQKTRTWFETAAPYSEDALHALEVLIERLAEHYTRLLQAHGENHGALIRSAYGTRVQYQAFLKELLSLEDAFDKALVHGATDRAPLEQRLQEKRQQREEQRERDTDAIFLS